MKRIESDNYTKLAGKTERGKRDGTGPFEGSAQRSVSDKGKRKEMGIECPYKDEDKKDKDKDKDKDKKDKKE